MISGIVVGCVCVLFYIWKQGQRAPVLELYVWQEKSSQMIFIRTPDDRRVLINGGPNPGIVRRITSVLPFYTRRIDTVIVATTDDKDVSGLIDVVGRYDVHQILVPAITKRSVGISTSTPLAYGVFLGKIASRQKEARDDFHLESFRAGTSFALSELSMGSSSGERDKDQKVVADILFPADGFVYSKASPPQLVMKISYGRNVFLVLGDATTKIQKYIASSSGSVAGVEIASDVLLTSQSDIPKNFAKKFLEIVQPKHVVYSKAVSRAGVSVFSEKHFNVRESGEVKIISDGVTLQIL